MSENTKTSVIRAGGILAFAILLSRVLGMLRDSVMLAQFGIGRDTDAYQLAILIPDMVFMLVAGGGLSSAFIPIFSDYWHNDKKEQAWRIFGTIVWVTTLVGVGLVTLAWVFTPQIVDFFRDKKPAEIIPPASAMARIILPAQIAFLTGSVMLGALYARKYFTGPSLAPSIYNIGIIAGAVALPAMFGMGIEAMAWGALTGAFVGNILVPLWLLKRTGAKLPFVIDLKDPGVRKFFVLLLPVILGFSLPSMVTIITQKFASFYGSDGINTILRQSNNVMQAPLGIFGQSLAMAAFPVLSEFFATQQMDKYRDQVSKTFRTVLYLSLPSCALLIGMAPLVIYVLYGHGKAAGNVQELQAMATCLQIYCIGIAAWSVQPVLMRAYFSMQMTALPIAIGTAMTAVFIGLCWYVTRYPLTFVGEAYMGIPWATNVAVILLSVILYVVLEKKAGSLDRKAIAGTLGKSAFASAIVGAISYFATAFMSKNHAVLNIVVLLGIGLVMLWLYYYITARLQMPESAYLRRAFARLERKKADS
jgi:putative peptidoglycan lipid II flippase